MPKSISKQINGTEIYIKPLNEFINSTRINKIYEEYRNKKFLKKISNRIKKDLFKKELEKWTEQFDDNFKIDNKLFTKDINLKGVKKEELKVLFYALTKNLPNKDVNFKKLKEIRYFQYLIIKEEIMAHPIIYNISIETNFIEKELNNILQPLTNLEKSNMTNEEINLKKSLEEILFILNKMVIQKYEEYQKTKLKDNFLNYYFQNLDFDTPESEKMFEIAKKYKFDFASIPHLFYTDDKTMKKFLKEIKPVEKEIMKKMKIPNKQDYLLPMYKDKKKYTKSKNELIKPMDRNLKKFFENNIKNIYSAFEKEMQKKLELPDFNVNIIQFLYMLKEFAPEKIFELKQKFEKMLKAKEQLKQQKGDIASRELLLSIRNIQTILTHINQIIEKFGLNNKQNLKTEENIELNNF